MRALRGVFFFIAASAACFADGSVKRDIARAARIVVGISSVLFLIAEAIELIS